MKKYICSALLLLAVAAFCLLPIEARAEEVACGTCGDSLMWTLDDTDTLTISGSGAVQYSGNAPWYDYARNIKTISIGPEVTEINIYMFNNCDNLEDIWVDAGNAYYSSDEYGVLFNKEKTELIRFPARCFGAYMGEYEIPESVTAIWEHAFYNAGVLSAITLPNNLQYIGYAAFWECWGLAGDLIIPAGVTYIEDLAFKGCDGLERVFFAGDAPQLNGSPFLYFEDLPVFVPVGNTTWTDSVMQQNYGGTLKWARYGSCGENLLWTLDDEGTLTIEGEGDMEDYSDNTAPWTDYADSVVKVDIADGVTSVGDCAFYQMWGLTRVSLGADVASIGTNAFAYTGLTDITIPDSITSIGYQAFYASALTEVWIPANVQTIDWYAFLGCDALTSICVAPENQSYSSDECGVLFNKDKTHLICYPGGRAGAYDIPNGVISFSYLAFAFCDGLTAVQIPDGVTVLELELFYCCENLETVGIPATVTEIKSNAFGFCSAITEIHYNGSEEQWSAITIEFGNDAVKNATVNFAVVPCVHSYGAWERVNDSTHRRTCTLCRKDVQMGNHTWNTGKVTDEAGCNKTGTKIYTCSNCGATKTETIEKTAHSYAQEWSTDESGHWLECSVCGDKKNMAAHTPGATATETSAQICSFCSYVIVQPLGHTHSYGAEWARSDGQHWHSCACGAKTDTASHAWDEGKVTQEPTQTETGIQTFSCTVCGAKREQVLSKLPADPQPSEPDGTLPTQPTATDGTNPTEPASAPTSPLPQEGNDVGDGNTGVMIAVIASAVVLGIAFVLLIVIKKKK